MNTINELTQHGIDVKTAESMIDGYKRRIGTRNGIYIIADITFDFTEHGRDVELKCSDCGRVIHRMMIKGRNKWSELIKSCPCQKENKAIEKKEEHEKFLKKKKDEMKIRVGKTHGDYMITSLDEKSGRMLYTMRCNECKSEIQISADIFPLRKNFHCTNHYSPVKYGDEYVGQKRNYLTVDEIVRLDDGSRKFRCTCDCGNVVDIEACHWYRGIVKSCGCMHNELNRVASTKHGCSGDRLYRVWRGMKERCQNPNNDHYENYGGRGIKVCDEWQEFINFKEWALKNGYDYNAKRGDCTIDRIEVNGNYEPSNCRWADMKTQANNKRPPSEWKKRPVKTWNINGVEKSRKDWCDEYGISSVEVVVYRMDKMGLTLQEALETPKKTNGRPRKEQSYAHIV